jgi:hypothetical protein
MWNSDDKILSVSEPKVMESAAGFYVGQSCETELLWENGTTDVITEPYDRLSAYLALIN